MSLKSFEQLPGSLGVSDRVGAVLIDTGQIDVGLFFRALFFRPLKKPLSLDEFGRGHGRMEEPKRLGQIKLNKVNRTRHRICGNLGCREVLEQRQCTRQPECMLRDLGGESPNGCKLAIDPELSLDGIVKLDPNPLRRG